MLRALIFDVDGTLADTESVHLAAFNHAFEQAGMGWHWIWPSTRSCWTFRVEKSVCCTTGAACSPI
jgi:phosphoglycolate phosphatase-like HAD superfamily hydrolase